MYAYVHRSIATAFQPTRRKILLFDSPVSKHFGFFILFGVTSPTAYSEDGIQFNMTSVYVLKQYLNEFNHLILEAADQLSPNLFQ